MRFSLWDSSAAGVQIGSALTMPRTVSNGVFTAPLDFGSVFAGDALWLNIEVRIPPGSGVWTTLLPRQPLLATPYALASKSLILPYSKSISSASPLLSLANLGTSRAATFQISNAASVAHAVRIDSNAGERALGVYATGTGGSIYGANSGSSGYAG